MDISLRDYRAQDFETLWRIDQQCFPPGISYSRADLRAYMYAPGGFTLVAEKIADGTVLGFLMAECRNETGHIITIDVLFDGRRRGIGSKLLAAGEQSLKAANCERVALEAAVDNVSALTFYKRHGYVIRKTIPNYYSNGLDAFAMGKKIG